MLGLGWTEMLVIGVMALIVIGPKDLPVVMNRIGKVAGQIRRMGTEFQREINKTTGLDEVRNLRNSITAPLKKTSDEIRKEFNAMTPTGAKPSGVIKPADPDAESVVDEIKAKAGMSEPAKPKTADEIAREAGFKPAGPAPKTSSATFGKPAAKADKPAAAADKPAAKPKAARKAPAKAKAAPTSPVTSGDLPAVADTAADVKKPTPARKPAAKKAAPVAKKTAPAKAAATGADADVTPAKSALKKRAPAKSRAAATPKAAPKTAAKAGDE
ncbi:twin-arginine translocase subunit TatB [Devosia sp. BSSL-BM10]|uniref:Sec-independent protein translocase protein TatB n=1 Tax=Devosia litorisediminis TaxID=2829817 RepID=A0A942EF50_9HYPH|nr:Sec-independent protein translocase protein TatB [Devosia litorisediminis]MBS3848671.1 twin-arginine translocase subunit TatB [Devosia litorisediminis]